MDDNPKLWAGSQRPKNVHELMTANWEHTVGKDDIVLHLGDLAFGRGDNSDPFVYEHVPRLTGKKYIVRGANHDGRRRKWYRRHGFYVLEPFTTMYNGYEISFSHFPQPKWIDGSKTRISVHGHTHERLVSHNGRRADPRFVNVCVEQTAYKPVWITDVLDEAIRKIEAYEGPLSAPRKRIDILREAV
jgi:calcineurin-like phosphoesterase family protein